MKQKRPAAEADPPRCQILWLGYCWAEHPTTHVRCCEPKGHPPGEGSGRGGHIYPYTPRTEW